MGNITSWNRRRLITAGSIVAVFAVVAAVPWRVVAQQPAPVISASSVPKASGPSTMPASEPAHAAADTFNQNASGLISMPSATIRSLTSGAVEQVNVIEGQTVKKGDVLVQLDSKARADAVASASEIEKTSAERFTLTESQSKAGVATVSDVAQAKLDLDKARDVLRQREEELAGTKITAPYDGTIGTMGTSAAVGSTVLSGDFIASVVNSTQPFVDFDVPAEESRELKRGMQIEIASRDMSETLGKGEITAAGPAVDPNTGTMHFRARLTATRRTVAPGEFVNVRFHSGKMSRWKRQS